METETLLREASLGFASDLEEPVVNSNLARRTQPDEPARATMERTTVGSADDDEGGVY
jgi:hypothetical protein